MNAQLHPHLSGARSQGKVPTLFWCPCEAGTHCTYPVPTPSCQCMFYLPSAQCYAIYLYYGLCAIIRREGKKIHLLVTHSTWAAGPPSVCVRERRWGQIRAEHTISGDWMRSLFGEGCPDNIMLSWKMPALLGRVGEKWCGVTCY